MKEQRAHRSHSLGLEAFQYDEFFKVGTAEASIEKSLRSTKCENQDGA